MPCYVPRYHLTVCKLIQFRVDRMILEAAANLHVFNFIQMVVK